MMGQMRQKQCPADISPQKSNLNKEKHFQLVQPPELKSAHLVVLVTVNKLSQNPCEGNVLGRHTLLDRQSPTVYSRLHIIMCVG